tara:strand:- start:477 stop:1088 length:612 start_codon:yes stop_codon:yes gene_type:complete
MIGIIDYNMNNLTCVKSAIDYLGFKSKIIKNSKKLNEADKIILPGVGAFGDAIKNLENKSLVEALYDSVIQKKKPFLGICLGAQLICKESDEHGKNLGFGWFENKVQKIIPNKFLRVPHNGWNNIRINNKSSLLLKNINDESLFYFNHSHAIDGRNLNHVSASCDHVTKFAAVIEKNNIFAVQFHPEKSQKDGLTLIKNFLSI